MSETRGRIVVAFDPQRPDPAPLRLALPIARSLAQALVALYVADEDTLALGEFGCLATVCAATGSTRPLSREFLEREFRRLEREARATFQSLAGDALAEFATARGRLSDELRRAGERAAVVLLGRPAGVAADRAAAAREIATLLELPVGLAGLVASPQARAAGVLMVLRPSRLATRGPGAHDSPLLAAARAALGPAGECAHRVSGAEVTVAGLLQSLRMQRIGTVLLERGAVADERALVAGLLAAWPGSLLTLREPDHRTTTLEDDS